MINNWQKKKILFAKEHQEKAFDLVNDIIIKKRDGRVITLVDDTKLVEFCSCSYLGLDLHKQVIRAGSKDLDRYGVSFPVARTRIRTENLVELENLLNQIFFGYCTVFVSLHLAHLGFFPLLGSGEMPSFPLKENGPHFILDKCAHASIQINRGILSQFGTIELIDFQSTSRIEEAFYLASKNNKTPISISDSIGSMGGIAPINFLVDMVEKYDGYSYFDDAHGTSVFGKHGSGYVLEKLNYRFHPRFILAASLSKGFGTNAGCIVLPTREDESMVKRFSNTYLFGNPPPFSIINSAIASANIHLSDEIYELQNRLWNNVSDFDHLLHEHIINSQKRSPIRGVLIGNEFKTIEITKELRDRGFVVTAAMYPTVAKNHAMLRVALSALHEKEQVFSLCRNIKEIMMKFDIEKNIHSFSIEKF